MVVALTTCFLHYCWVAGRTGLFTTFNLLSGRTKDGFVLEQAARSGRRGECFLFFCVCVCVCVCMFLHQHWGEGGGILMQNVQCVDICRFNFVAVMYLDLRARCRYCLEFKLAVLCVRARCETRQAARVGLKILPTTMSTSYAVLRPNTPGVFVQPPMLDQPPR